MVCYISTNPKKAGEAIFILSKAHSKEDYQR